MTMLYQIERNLRAKMQQKKNEPWPSLKSVHGEDTNKNKMPAPAPVDPTTPAKTIGVKVDAKLYTRLRAIQAAHGLKSIKEALLLAARAGVEHVR